MRRGAIGGRLATAGIVLLLLMQASCARGSASQGASDAAAVLIFGGMFFLSGHTEGGCLPDWDGQAYRYSDYGAGRDPCSQWP